MQPSQQHQAFTPLLDRGLPSSVALAQWCPTMDLLALLTADGQLQLHRLNWQKLWSVTPESPITSLCWRPDGKQIAIGQEDGYVLLLNTEDGETQEQAKIFHASVVALSWTHSSLENNNNSSSPTTMVPQIDRARFLFDAPLPVAPPHSQPTSAGFENYAERLGKREECTWPPKLDVLSLLVGVSASRELALCGEGLFLLAKFPFTSDNTMMSSSCIQQVAMPPTLAEVAIRWQSQKEQGDGDGGGEEEILSIVDTSLLARNHHVLRLLCSYAADITRGLDICRTVTWQIWKEWIFVRTTLSEFSSQLNTLLKQHAVNDAQSESDAQSDLLLLITMGEYTPPMEQFLMNTLGEAGLKKVARGVDAALTAAHALLTDRLQPEAEILAFRLGELRGLAAAPRTRKLLGLHCSEVGAAERSCLLLLTQLEQIRERLTAVSAQYRTFFAWLMTALRRFPEDTVDTMMGYPLSHIDVVRDFLHSEFEKSTLEPYLSSQADPECVSSKKYDAFDPGEMVESQSFDSWVDSALEEADYVDTLLKTVDVNFKREELMKRDLWSETQEAATNAGELAYRDRGAVQSVDRLHAYVQKMLLRPAAAITHALCSENNALRQWTLIASPSKKSTSSSSSSLCAQSNAMVYSEKGELTCALPCFIKNKEEKEEEQECVAYFICSAAVPLPSNFSSFSQRNASERLINIVVRALPQDSTLLDVGCYKNGALAMLLQNSQSSSLAVAPFEKFEKRQVSCEIFDDDGGGAENGILSSGGVGSGALPLPQPLSLELSECRVREFAQQQQGHRPMAVSATRGIGFVVCGNNRAILYDLVEDEEEEEEEEGVDE